MNKERTVITQQLCDHVKALLAGKLTHKKAAEFTGIGKATVDRIVAAGFNAEQYAKNTAAKKEEKEKKQAEEERKETQQIVGQMEMDLQPAEEQEEYVDVNMKVKKDGRVAVVNEGNFMRFQAKQADKIREDIQAAGYRNVKAIYELKAEMNTIRDLLGQILRRMK